VRRARVSLARKRPFGKIFRQAAAALRRAAEGLAPLRETRRTASLIVIARRIPAFPEPCPDRGESLICRPDEWSRTRTDRSCGRRSTRQRTKDRKRGSIPEIDTAEIGLVKYPG